MSHPNPPTASPRPSPALSVTVVSSFYVGITLLIFLTVSTLAFLIFAPQAVANELTPDAPGSIAGVVKTSAGELRAGIEVTLYKRDPYQSDPWTRLRIITTQADGQYRFTLLPTGLYRIGAGDPARVYAPTFYPTAQVLQKANDISVVGNQLEGMDLTLQLAGQISGVVTLSGGVTMTYGSVELRREVERATGNVWEAVQTIPLPATSGVYSFTGLSAMPYRICATAAFMNLASSECYDNVYDVAAATSLTLTAGATISHVNLVLGDGADFAQLSGRVTSLTNEPLAEIEVYAMPIALEETPVPLPTAVPSLPLAADGPLYIPSPAYYAQTDEAGNYRFSALVAGSYHFYFIDTAGAYAFEYYNDTLLPETALALEIGKKEVISDVNIQLVPASHLQGLITVLGQPAPYAAFTAEMKTAFGWRYVTGATTDPNTGRYAIGGLPAGVYRVTASTYLNDGYTSYYYGGYAGGSTLESAAEIALAVGVTKTADITLSGGPRFEGSVAGRVTANGAPLAGAKVSLYPGGFICCSSLLPPPLVYVFTDAEGRYAMSGLAGNIYGLGVADPTGIYATTYYTGHAIPGIAKPLYVVDDNPLAEINVNLPPGGAISGRVTRRDGQPLPRLLVTIYTPSPFNTPSPSGPIYGPAQPVSADVKTDAEGRYTIKGLHAGEYYVCFLETWGNNRECYGASPLESYSISSGVRVKVVPGETQANIDLLWGPDLTSYLPFIAQ